MELPLLVFAAGLAGVVTLGGLAVRAQRRRAARLRAFADAQGWSLTARDDVWARSLEGEPFGHGAARRCENVFTGRHRDRDVVAFDYSCRTQTTDGNGQVQQQVHRWSVAVLPLPAPLPRVEVQPAGLLSFGGLRFESEAFNDRYRVRADDPRVAYDVLPARSLQLLLDRPDVAVRLLGGCAVTWRRGLLDPPELLARLDTVSDLLDAVPTFVWKDRA